MKKIALLTDGWKRLIVYAWVDGIMKRSQEVGEEICLYHYNCYGNWSHDERHNQGEYNIFNLPDLSQFDGIVIDCNNIEDKERLQHLIDLVRACKVPAISINYDVEGFYYVGIDNKKPIVDMIAHLYEKHGCRSFVFAGGPKDNYENSVRTETYLECLKKYGLEEADNPVFNRDYDFDTGVYYMQKLLWKHNEMPDAIICANDNIAAGICTEAEKNGFHVPQDFLVTGFDNLDKAAYFQPQLTTVDHRREEIGGKSLDILRELWQGETPGKYRFVTTECLFSESCGCPNSKAVDYRTYMKNQITAGVEKDKEDVMLVDLESRMSKCSSFSEIFSQMGDFLREYDCDGFFIVVDEGLLKAETNTDFAVDGYKPQYFKVVYAEDFTQDVEIDSIETLERYMESFGAKSEYLFTPIHFKEQTIGYSILKNGHFLYDNPHYYDIHSILVKEMEALYRRQQMENINQKLRDIYNRDQLTGLYNRIAYNEKLEPAFEDYAKEGIICSIIFIDIDKFKHINDTYGHKYGDEVIKKVGKLIQDSCPENSFSFRYGGDEFVMFLPDMDREAVNVLKKNMQEAAKVLNIGISIGIAVTSPGEGKTLQAYVEAADQDMYNEKMSNRN